MISLKLTKIELYDLNHENITIFQLKVLNNEKLQTPLKCGINSIIFWYGIWDFNLEMLLHSPKTIYTSNADEIDKIIPYVNKHKDIYV